jgi:hypothetical protein
MSCSFQLIWIQSSSYFLLFVPRIAPNPCNHYYLREDGEDSYVDFLARNGYLPAIGSVVSAGDIESEGTTNKKKVDWDDG